MSVLFNLHLYPASPPQSDSDQHSSCDFYTADGPDVSASHAHEAAAAGASGLYTERVARTLRLTGTDELRFSEADTILTRCHFGQVPIGPADPRSTASSERLTKYGIEKNPGPQAKDFDGKPPIYDGVIKPVSRKRAIATRFMPDMISQFTNKED